MYLFKTYLEPKLKKFKCFNFSTENTSITNYYFRICYTHHELDQFMSQFPTKLEFFIIRNIDNTLMVYIATKFDSAKLKPWECATKNVALDKFCKTISPLSMAILLTRYILEKNNEEWVIFSSHSFKKEIITYFCHWYRVNNS
jgi:hypothetical protein